MNFLYRSIKSLIYKYKNTLLTVVIFVVLSTLILSGICINQASVESEKAIRQNIGATVTANSGMVFGSTPSEQNGISLERIEEIAAFPEVKFTSFTVLSSAFPVGFDAVLSDEQASEYAGVAPLYISGNSNTLDSSFFTSGEYETTVGEYVESDDEKSAVVHYTILENSNLSIGDSIKIRSANNDVEVELKIIGTFTSDASETESERTGNPQFNSENHIFTSTSVALSLNTGAFVRSAVFGVIDPEEVGEVIDRAEALPRIERFDDTAIYTKQDSEYKSVASTLNSVRMISVIMVVASIVMGAVILTLLVMISLKSRDFEIGVLLSMGESRVKIVNQLIIEALVPVLLATMISLALSSFTASAIGGYVGGGELEIGVGSFAILMIFIVSIALVLIASLNTAVKVIRYKPKEMLMKAE